MDDFQKNQITNGPGKARVSHWACCLEEHREGSFHYHVSLKLSAPKKWLMVKKYYCKRAQRNRTPLG